MDESTDAKGDVTRKRRVSALQGDWVSADADDGYDYVCAVCKLGGALLICDGERNGAECTFVWHRECVCKLWSKQFAAEGGGTLADTSFDGDRWMCPKCDPCYKERAVRK
jgi:hypothetical protein